MSWQNPGTWFYEGPGEFQDFLPGIGVAPIWRPVQQSAPVRQSGAALSPPPQATPVSPVFDPKIDANALYGKAMALYTGGYARMGASPAPIVGPYIGATTVDFIVSFGVPSNPAGDRKIYNIWLDNELAWSSVAGGTVPGDGTFAAEAFDFVFKPGTLTQTVCSLETTHFPGDECAYRPQMLLQITGIPFARFMENTKKPVPYVAVDIGDVTDGADPLDGINLGEALERIAHSPWCGYSPASFESVGITDVVDAILIKDNFTIIDLCRNVTGEYRNIDLLISDKIRVKDRGSNVTPNFLLDRDSIIADDNAVSVTRGSATGQRREHELLAIDPDQDYTAVPSLSKIPRDPMIISAAVGKETVTSPLVIDANTRQALATFSQNYQENARRRVTLKIGAAGYGIEPGDLYALTNIADGFDNEVFKCTQTAHGANWVVEVEGEAILRCSIYGEEIFFGATWDPATVALATLSGGNLIVTNTGGAASEQGARVAPVSAKSSGKFYFELSMTIGGLGFLRTYGIGPPTASYTDMSGSVGGCMVVLANSHVWSNGVDTGIAVSGVIPDLATVRIAVDLDNRKIWFSVHTVGSVGSGDWNANASYDPATNVGGVTIPTGAMVPFCTFGGFIGSSGCVNTANFGGSTFVDVVPTGFTPGWPV